MNNTYDFLSILSDDEKTALQLSSLYSKEGYEKYRMSKFEEYDLYGNYKDFLVSEKVIAFIDTDGRFLALKPDVTLSIIKNYRDNFDLQTKIYYKENVYRVSGKTGSFKEIMQVGLERLGFIDDAAITEVLSLAARTLDEISDRSVLEISSLSIVSSILDSTGLSELGRKEILRYLGEKNLQGALGVCERESLDKSAVLSVKTLVTLYGEPEKLKELYSLPCCDAALRAEIDRFITVADAISKCDTKCRISLDFSVVNDMDYYNGFVFRGFVEGAPSSVLSGGQYDRLMKKMNKKSGAIGFAVYIDELSRLGGGKL